MLGVELHNYGRFQPYQQSFDSTEPAKHKALRSVETGQSANHFNPLDRIQRIINHRLTDSIGTTARNLPFNRQEGAFDAQTVADNVLGTVQSRLRQAAEEGADEQQLQALREQAASGMEQGVQEARKALEGLGILNGSLDTEIDRVADLLARGLDAGSADATPAAGDAATVALEQRFRQQAEASFELEIVTRDGDQVSLKFQHSSSEEGVLSSRQSAYGESMTASHSVNSAQRFELSVEGELDAEEMAAITDFTREIADFSESFFDGDVQAAFEQGMQMGYDSEQIAGFALEMEFNRSSSAATRYQEISALAADEAPKMIGLEQVSGLLDQLRGLIGQAEALFEQPEQETTDLLTGFVSHHPKAREFTELSQRHGGDDIEGVVEKMVGQVSREDHEHDD